MSQATDFETDPFLRLLTDALRAGPGSPQWHEAVRQLRTVNPDEADEYRLIVTAREHLESGRDYRTLRAGPGFTRKVFDSIEREAARGPGLPLASAIAIVAVLAVAGTVLALVLLLMRSDEPPPTVEDLSRTYFTQPIISSEFVGVVPPEWQTFGAPPQIAAAGRGLRGGNGAAGQYRGGGIRVSMPLPADQSFAVEMTVRAARPTDQVDLRLFVSESPEFSTEKAVSPREFEVRIFRGQIGVFKPVAVEAGSPVKLPDGPATIRLLLKMDRNFAVVERDGVRLYAGPHGLGADAPRWPGVRFLTRGDGAALEDVLVQSIRLLRP